MNSIIRNLKILLVLLAIGGFSNNAKASHIAGGELTYLHLGGDTFLLTFRISFFCGGTGGNPTAGQLNSFGGLARTTISNSCNTTTITPNWVAVDTVLVTPVCPNSNTNCNGGSVLGIEQYVFQDTLVLTPKCDNWTVGVRYNARNASANLLRSTQTGGNPAIPDA